MKSKSLPVLALLVCCAAAPARAEAGDCEADLQALGRDRIGLILKDVFPGRDGTGAPAVLFEEGRCVVREVALEIGTSAPYQQVVHADEVRWIAEWSTDERPFPPTRLMLEASGLWQGIESDEIDATIAYQMRLVGEAAPFGLTIDYAYDPATQRLDLRRFDIGSDSDGLSATLVADGFRPDPILNGTASVDEVLALRPTLVDIRLRNGILFETMAGGWLPLIHPRLGQTPDAAVAQAKRVAQGQLAAVPEDVLPEPSRTALSAMVESLPHPAGELRLHMAAPEGLVLSDVARALAVSPPTWAGLAEALSDTSLEAEWTPRTAK